MKQKRYKKNEIFLFSSIISTQCKIFKLFNFVNYHVTTRSRESSFSHTDSIDFMEYTIFGKANPLSSPTDDNNQASPLPED